MAVSKTSIYITGELFWKRLTLLRSSATSPWKSLKQKLLRKRRTHTPPSPRHFSTRTTRHRARSEGINPSHPGRPIACNFFCFYDIDQTIAVRSFCNVHACARCVPLYHSSDEPSDKKSRLTDVRWSWVGNILGIRISSIGAGTCMSALLQVALGD